MKINRRQKPVIKKEDVLLVLDNDGIPQRINAKTGLPIGKLEFTERSIELFHEGKANILCQALALGDTLSISLQKAKITSASFLHWKKTNIEFTNLMEKARELRAEFVHESFYANEKEKLLESTDTLLQNTEGDSLKEKSINAMHILKLLEKKQSILTNFKQEDAPTRFGVKYSKQSNRVEGSFAFEATVDPEIMKLIQKNFTPIINQEGDIELPQNEPLSNEKDKPNVA